MMLKAFHFIILFPVVLLRPQYHVLAQDDLFKEVRIGMPKDSALACFAGKFLLLPMPTPFWRADTTYLVSDFRGSRGGVGMIRCDSMSVVTIAENVGAPYRDTSTVAFFTQVCDLISPFTNVNEAGDRSVNVKITLRELKGPNMGTSRRMMVNLNDTTLINFDILLPADPLIFPSKVTTIFVQHKRDPDPLAK